MNFFQIEGEKGYIYIENGSNGIKSVRTVTKISDNTYNAQPDPEVVLLGGGVVNMPDFPREELNRRILARTRKPLPAQRLHILYTEDEPEKCVIGAAFYAGEQLKR